MARRGRTRATPAAAIVAALVIVGVAVSLAVSGIGSGPHAGQASAGPSDWPVPVDAAGGDALAGADTVQAPGAAAALAALAGVPEDASLQGTGVPYKRDAFGERWADVDGNGCDTRNDVLRRDLTQVVLRDGNGCKVLSGMLLDPYTGATVAFVSGEDTSPLVPIDHVVALAWAWRHGADGWTAAERLAFANDPRNLLATTKDVNQDKSDSGPAEWLPPDAAARCDYAEQYIAVIVAWRLTVDAADRAALAGVLQDC